MPSNIFGGSDRVRSPSTSREISRKTFLCHRDLCYLEGHVGSLVDKLYPDLHEIFAEVRQQPLLSFVGERARAQDTSHVVDERLEMKTRGRLRLSLKTPQSTSTAGCAMIGAALLSCVLLTLAESRSSPYKFERNLGNAR